MVGARGFEPPTLSSRTIRATKLRHAPTEGARWNRPMDDTPRSPSGRRSNETGATRHSYQPVQSLLPPVGGTSRCDPRHEPRSACSLRPASSPSSRPPARARPVPAVRRARTDRGRQPGLLRRRGRSLRSEGRQRRRRQRSSPARTARRCTSSPPTRRTPAPAPTPARRTGRRSRSTRTRPSRPATA